MDLKDTCAALAGAALRASLPGTWMPGLRVQRGGPSSFRASDFMSAGARAVARARTRTDDDVSDDRRRRGRDLLAALAALRWRRGGERRPRAWRLAPAVSGVANMLTSTVAVCLISVLASNLGNDRRRLTRGSGVSFDEYEAEHGTCGWHDTPQPCHVPQPGNRSFGSFSSESSGRQSVRLARDGEYVEIAATAGAANSVVVRYSIPDAPEGGGINSSLSLYIDGDFHSSLAVTSRFAWDYGYWTIPYSENPADGGAHHFFDEVRVLLHSNQTARVRFLNGKLASFHEHRNEVRGQEDEHKFAHQLRRFAQVRQTL